MIDAVQKCAIRPKDAVRVQLDYHIRVELTDIAGEFAIILGEILATEAVPAIVPTFQVPIKRLRWLDGRESALRGEDVIGISVESITADKLPAVPSGSIDQALVGKIAGAQISSVDGTPGARGLQKNQARTHVPFVPLRRPAERKSVVIVARGRCYKRDRVWASTSLK